MGLRAKSLLILCLFIDVQLPILHDALLARPAYLRNSPAATPASRYHLLICASLSPVRLSPHEQNFYPLTRVGQAWLDSASWTRVHDVVSAYDKPDMGVAKGRRVLVELLIMFYITWEISSHDGEAKVLVEARMLLLYTLPGLIAAASGSLFNASEDAALRKAYIIQLSPQGKLETPKRSTEHLNQFHRRAASLDYSVRHEFLNPDIFLGLSIQLTGYLNEDEALAQLHDIPGVVSASSVYNVSLPVQPGVRTSDGSALSSFEAQPPLAVSGNGNLASSLEMGGVDKLHQLGIKGKGIKVGVIDTGVDYRHPALGSGFGPGHKIAGGYSFVLDNGTLQGTPDPLATCYGGGHGTHARVSSIS